MASEPKIGVGYAHRLHGARFYVQSVSESRLDRTGYRGLTRVLSLRKRAGGSKDPATKWPPISTWVDVLTSSQVCAIVGGKRAGV
jgi:hypothetical protein